MDESLGSTNDPLNSAQSLDKKKIMIIAGVGIFMVLLMILFFIFSRPNSVSENNQSNQGTGGNKGLKNGSNNGTVPTILPSNAVANKPEDAAMSFYNWYVNHPSPLSSRAYEERQDVTEEFRQVMGRFVEQGIDPGYDHIFNCEVTPPKNATFRSPEIEATGQTALVGVIGDGAGILFNIRLEKSGNTWLVDDVYCP